MLIGFSWFILFLMTPFQRYFVLQSIEIYLLKKPEPNIRKIQILPFENQADDFNDPYENLTSVS
jgi:hypothetical protein